MFHRNGVTMGVTLLSLNDYYLIALLIARVLNPMKYRRPIH